MEEKKFKLVETVALVFLGIINDVLVLLTWLFGSLLAKVGIGFGIVAVTELINAFLGGTILVIFIFKLRSFGAGATLQTSGIILEFFGIPSRTLTVSLGIYIANRPKLAAIAQVASGKIAARTTTASGKAVLNKSGQQTTIGEKVKDDWKKSEEYARRLTGKRRPSLEDGGEPEIGPGEEEFAVEDRLAKQYIKQMENLPKPARDNDV